MPPTKKKIRNGKKLTPAEEALRNDVQRMKWIHWLLFQRYPNRKITGGFGAFGEDHVRQIIIDQIFEMGLKPPKKPSLQGFFERMNEIVLGSQIQNWGAVKKNPNLRPQMPLDYYFHTGAAPKEPKKPIVRNMVFKELDAAKTGYQKVSQDDRTNAMLKKLCQRVLQLLEN